MSAAEVGRLDAIEIETGPAPGRSVIWMHGLGADGHDFVPIVPELGLPAAPAARFVFPHAPMRPVTINAGMVMRAWYDVFELGAGPEDEAGIRASQALVEALIAREQSRGVAAGGIVLAGFSQGGVMALSCHVPLARTLAAETSAASLDVPLFMAHGIYDDLIPVALARRSRDLLQKLGYRVEWREYPMAHSVSAEEIGDISRWLRGALGLGMG